MDSQNITMLIILLLLLVERIFKRIKKSSCLGGSVEFNENSSPKLNIDDIKKVSAIV